MDESLFKKTMQTVAILVGACVTFVGALTLVALFVVGRAVSPAGADTTDVGASPVEKMKTDAPSVSPGASPQAAPRVAPAAPRRFGMTKSPT